MSGVGPMVGSCERGNGPPGSMNSREHLVPLCCYQTDCLCSNVVLLNRSLSSLRFVVPSWGIY